MVGRLGPDEWFGIDIVGSHVGTDSVLHGASRAEPATLEPTGREDRELAFHQADPGG
jgi:hypothetical protein